VSVTFAVDCGSLPPPEQFLLDLAERLQWSPICCSGFFDEGQILSNRARSWQQHFKYLLYRPFVSERGVEVKLDLERCYVSLPPLAGRADFEMAVELLREFLQYAGGCIKASDGRSAASAAELKAVFDDQWYGEYLQNSLAELYYMVEKSPQIVLELAGPVRPFLFGSRLSTSLKASGGSVFEQLDKLWALMLRTQYYLLYPEHQGYCESTIYNLRVAGAEGCAAAYFPSCQGVLVPRVDFLAFDGLRGGSLHLLPGRCFHSRLPEVLNPSEIEFLDEWHFALAPLKDSRYSELVLSLSADCLNH